MKNGLSISGSMDDKSGIVTYYPQYFVMALSGASLSEIIKYGEGSPGKGNNYDYGSCGRQSIGSSPDEETLLFPTLCGDHPDVNVRRR